MKLHIILRTMAHCGEPPCAVFATGRAHDCAAQAGRPDLYWLCPISKCCVLLQGQHPTVLLKPDGQIDTGCVRFPNAVFATGRAHDGAAQGGRPDLLAVSDFHTLLCYRASTRRCCSRQTARSTPAAGSGTALQQTWTSTPPPRTCSRGRPRTLPRIVMPASAPSLHSRCAIWERVPLQAFIHHVYEVGNLVYHIDALTLQPLPESEMLPSTAEAGNVKVASLCWKRNLQQVSR